MAALLRQGARRIAGSLLQRTQAAVTSPAVGGEKRRLVPRRMYSTEERSHGGIAREIQQKKDELYDLIREGESNVRTSTWTNAWLLQYLSGEVTPRPYNANWRDLQEMRRTVSGIKSTGFVSLALLFVYYGVHFNDKKVAPAMMMMEEENEASEVETKSRLTGN